MLAFALGQWVLVCLLAGLLTGLLQNIPMAVQPEGYVPAYVAAGGLTGTDPTEADDALAVGVHHVTAMAAALLYGLIVFVWALSAFIYGVTLGLTVPVLVTQL